ncbi:MAG: hypothetical protein ACD_2C00205G0006 [uncultured bacterium (gcode 4)]|uniref:Uncharacterized protein n=1 Tax=uncultured bacterium (gcode 4) TaxID=1234023 RepID=K2G208_9BACT|nr:MAG: hypothetical protein ACD_2C00205G0006 [uncultured bacterium (gcode 4)]
MLIIRKSFEKRRLLIWTFCKNTFLYNVGLYHTIWFLKSQTIWASYDFRYLPWFLISIQNP